MRGLFSLGPFLAAAFALAGCAGRTSPQSSVVPGPPLEVLRRTRAALTRPGVACTQKNDVIVCETGPNTPDFVVLYDDTSRRLLFGTSLPIKRSCTDVLVFVNAFNQSVDVAQAACGQNKLAFVSPVLVPEAGLSAGDLLRFRQWWTTSLVSALRASGLLDFLDDDDAVSPGQQAKSASTREGDPYAVSIMAARSLLAEPSAPERE